MINQSQFIRQFTDKHREQFNDELFVRDEDQIIEELKKVILSCQRDKAFTIRVDKFTVVDDYNEIQRILYEYDLSKAKKGATVSTYLSLKESDVKLLIVDYFIAVHNTDDPSKASKNLRVIIEVPRVIDKYYFNIYGKRYSATFQILESTYNNTCSNSKTDTVTLKTMFMASRIFRFNIASSKEAKLKTTEGEVLDGIFYHSIIFTKSVQVMRYLLAKYGLYGFAKEVKVPYLVITSHDLADPTIYTIKRHNVYVSIPKYIYQNDLCAQSLVYTVCCCIDKETVESDMYTQEFWIKCLGAAYGNKSIEKGLSVLESLESIYDVPAAEHLHLPENEKDDIYKVMIWVIREYSNLRLKDNLDISMKRIRYAEYIAQLYALKISRGIFRQSDKGAKVTLSQIEKSIVTFPDFLLRAIAKDRLINCVNNVNDNDALIPLKYTYKGVSGLGEQGASIPNQYRRLHPSHIGRLDLDAASATDPGLSGTLCPMADIHNGSFSQDYESDNWRNDVDNMLTEFYKVDGITPVFEHESKKDDNHLINAFNYVK